LLGLTPRAMRCRRSAAQTERTGVAAFPGLKLAGHYAEGRQLMLEVLEADPGHDEATFQLGYLDLNLAIYLTYQPGGRERAEALLAEAIGRVTPLLEREPDLTQARDLLYRLHGALAQSLETHGRFADALTHRARALSLMTNTAERDHLRFLQALTLDRAGDHRPRAGLARWKSPRTNLRANS
jgi:hypothetical protein